MAQSESHSELIRSLWPDKALYGSVMLFLTGIVGIAFAAFSLAIDVEYSQELPRLLREYPTWLTIALSFLSLACAYVSLSQRDTKWAIIGGLCGLAAIGMLGVGSILALLALAYALKARHEREDTNPDTLRLTADRWPDKSLAASLLMLMTGIVSLAWGIALWTNWLHTEIDDQLLFGMAGVLVGLLCFFAALELYFQRALWVGVLAGVGGLMTFGFYIVGPMLSGASLVLLLFAWKEREFRSQQREKEALARAGTQALR